MRVVRSLLFYLAFYTGSALFVTTAALVAMVAPSRVRPVPDTWSRYQRLCLRLVGISVREVGDIAAHHRLEWGLLVVPSAILLLALANLVVRYSSARYPAAGQESMK